MFCVTERDSSLLMGIACVYLWICAYLYNLGVYSLFLRPALLRLQTTLRSSADS